MPTSIQADVNSTIVIFGASGDLTARKLMPALYMLWNDGFLPDDSPIVGAARREKTNDSFRNEMFAAVNRHSRSGPIDAAKWNRFASRLYYQKMDLTDSSDYHALKSALVQFEKQAVAESAATAVDHVVYLATAPSLFVPAASALSAAGMVPDRDSEHTLRVVFEKPFGRDLESSLELSDRLGHLMREDQIYRIDHYLGKETVQNILLFRFGNMIFEPLLNRNHVNSVQITVAESQGIESGRGGYYDNSGALRDVLQNHVLQLLCLIAMEPPAMFQADAIRDEKLKVLQALAPGAAGGIDNWVVSGQFAGYREIDRIPQDSRRETYVAMRVAIDNWRWAGVPFFLRTGKRMPHRVTEISVQFKQPPLNLFSTVECDGDMCELVGARPNTLIFRIQPHESIGLSCSTKRPGMQYQIHPVEMEFEYEEAFETVLPEAYERLLLDVMRGDSTLFTRSDELEAAWRFVTPVLQHWERKQDVPQSYLAGTWGPNQAEALLAKTAHAWRQPTGQD